MFEYSKLNSSWAVKCRSAAQCALCALDVVVVVTMFHLSGSLKLVLNEIDIEKAKFQRRLAYTFGILYVVLFIVVILAIY